MIPPVLRPKRIFVVDGGAGARHVALLQNDVRVRIQSNPRHAELLLVFPPVNEKLTPSVVELFRAMPRPRGILLVEQENQPVANIFKTTLKPDICVIPAEGGVPQLLARLCAPIKSNNADPAALPWGAELVALPPKEERELATELLVLSLGPVQPYTAGPLRVITVCDGEQVFSATLESGYASRSLQQKLQSTVWPEALKLAGSLDPVAPVGSRLAFLTAIEQLARKVQLEEEHHRRKSALGWERAANCLTWLSRFSAVLAYDRLQRNATQLLRSLHDMEDASELLSSAKQLCHSVERDRFLKLRTTGVGKIDVARLQQLGIDGPVLAASENGSGDAHARLVVRLRALLADLPDAKKSAVDAFLAEIPEWPLPRGKASSEIMTARGKLRFTVESDGRSLTEAEWNTPSSALLPLVPGLLAGLKLPDAEVALASLDLSMAEADG